MHPPLLSNRVDHAPLDHAVRVFGVVTAHGRYGGQPLLRVIILARKHLELAAIYQVTRRVILAVYLLSVPLGRAILALNRAVSNF